MSPSLTSRPPRPLGTYAAQRAWFLAGVAAELGIAAIDAITGDRVVLTGFFIVPPLALATVLRPSRLAVLATFAFLLAVGSGAWNENLFSADHLVRLTVVGVGSALGVAASRATSQMRHARRVAETARAAAEQARMRAEGLVAELDATRHRLDRTLDSLAEAVTVNDSTGRMVYANSAAARLLGAASPDEVVAAAPGELAGRFVITREDGSPVGLEDLPAYRALRGEPAEALLTRSVMRSTGQEYWLLTKATRTYDAEGNVLAVNIIEDLTEAKDAELRVRFLSDASELLTSSLDLEQTLQRVAELVVPQYADWCGVEMLDDHGESHQVAVAHQDSAKIALAHRLRERYPPDPDGSTGVPAVLRTGRPELLATIPDELLVAATQDEEHLAIARELGMRSVIIVPMRAGERVMGALTLVAAESGRVYDEDDLALAQELARRAGTAVENARLYSQRAEIAHTLQQSLLPERLPEVPGWRTAALYRPGDRHSEVGGDFYDVVDADGALTVILGDVTGKGVHAAALTSLARHTARTAVLLGKRPEAILELLNRILVDQPRMSLVTAVCARLERLGDEVEVEVASAGHPLPLRVRPDEAAVELGRHGVLLGLDANHGWPTVRERMRSGDTILFYTDGVTDTPGADRRFGERALQDLVRRRAGDPDGLVAFVDAALRTFQHGTFIDDTALLAMQWVAPVAVAAGEAEASADEAGARL
jgi:PAS domain S-box-containing protein